MRVGVVGSRTWHDRPLFWKHLCAWLKEHPDLHLVSGGAKDGADALAEAFARQKGLPITIYHARWEDGKGAGFARNVLIAADCEVLLAFWDGKSKGTAHTISQALKRGIPCYVISPKGQVSERTDP